MQTKNKKSRSSKHAPQAVICRLQLTYIHVTVHERQLAGYMKTEGVMRHLATVSSWVGRSLSHDFKEKEGRYACLCRRLICGVHLTVQTIRVRVGDSPHVTIDSVITEGSTVIWLVDRCLTGSLSSVHPSPSQWRACSPSIFLSRSSAKQYTIRATYPPRTSRKHCRQLLS